MEPFLLDVQHCVAQAPWHRHGHRLCEMVYVKRGKARFTIAGVDYTAGPGCLVLISPLEAHQVRVLSAPYERYFALLSLPELSRALPQTRLTAAFRDRPPGFSHLMSLRGGKPAADALLARMDEEFAAGLPCAQEMLAGLLMQLLALACRACPDNFALPPGPAAERVLAVQQYMEEHFAQDLSIAGLAARFALSPSRLAHSFKAQTGYSPKQYIDLLRLSCARELLETTALPIQAVAARAGFGDLNNFIRAYRLCFGLPPGKWRRDGASTIP